MGNSTCVFQGEDLCQDIKMSNFPAVDIAHVPKGKITWRFTFAQTTKQENYEHGAPNTARLGHLSSPANVMSELMAGDILEDST